MQRNKNKNRQRNVGRSVEQRIVPHPTSVQVIPSFPLTFRFKAASGTDATYAITAANLLDLLVMGTAAATGSRFLGAAKLRRVSVWQPPTFTSGSPTSVKCALEYINSFGNTKTYFDTAVGSTDPAYVSAKPPKGPSSEWFSASTSLGAVFNLTVSTGAIIDVELTCSAQNGAVTAISTTLVGGGAGELAFHPLDGAGAVLQPYGPTYVM